LFTTADDVHDHLGRLLQELANDPDLGSRLTHLDLVLQLRCRHPDATVTLVARAADAPRVVVGEPGDDVPQPDVTLTMDADVAHHLWLGQQNVAIGIARGLIQAKGDGRKVIDLLGLTNDIVPRYEQLLRAAGREDLLTTAAA
jgi:ubiquinone biosynthesis protein UbiJ